MFLSILILTAHYLQKSLNLKSARPQAYHSVGKSRDCETARLPFIVSKTKLLQYNCRLEFVNQCSKMRMTVLSIHSFYGDVRQSGSILQRGADSLPEQETSGLELCSCFGRAYFAFLPLSPLSGESWRCST